MIISVVNQKGGVGKTTTVSNISSVLAQEDYRVLCVDLDPQANLSSIYLNETARKGVYEALTGDCSIEDILIRGEVDLIPSNLNLVNAEQTLAGEVSRESILSRLLEPYTAEYDFILIDNPPSLGLLVLNALTASNGVIIPVRNDSFSIEGIGNLMELMDTVKERLNKDLDLVGILTTMVDNRTNLSERFRVLMENKFGSKVLKPEIRQNADIVKAQLEGKAVGDYNPNATGSVEYRIIAMKLIGWAKKYTLNRYLK